MEKESRIKAEALLLRSGMTTILEGISFELKKGESIAITGSSGSGKTSLGRIISGQLIPTSGKFDVEQTLSRVMVDQQDHFLSLSGRRSTYYGQRYENQGMENSPTIEGYLEKVAAKAGLTESSGEVQEVMETMHISHLNDRKLLQLSNGERKRTQLAAALLQKPDILVLDQPFVGLDVESRQKLDALIKIQMQEGISFVIICQANLMPNGLRHILELHEGKQVQWCTADQFQSQISTWQAELEPLSPEFLSDLHTTTEQLEHVVRMRDVQVTIGGKQILQKIDWQVKPGEQWALLGHNGAGKTTLLSLVTADNPQGYSNDLVLFDRKRGSGESIWDIKNRIGFVSPELHLYFLRGEGIFNTIPGIQAKAHPHYDALSCLDVVVSGFRNEIGFASEPTDLQRDLAERWFPALGLSHLKDRLFLQASLGEQRSLLLARALVKSPSLLILDEPCQGLDEAQTQRFVHLLDQICLHLNTTMVYVTHHRNEIPACVSQLLELENGQVKFCGGFN
ncbi:ATP-binding cassette domain-containing protein [Mangrovibacterium lignilyticum]|uniref:ATP-binding cassette domain-containing protein n=1 Tax=Mangrovibacterium lignilyticum TaxID=2668052 RepID=UPI0013D1390E|nr:ATP-binding cassette domain-containing protein [Mangrovibacterium lignilyticum]